jgi:cytoskeletal protein CcmA (bactofilin family)
MHYEYCIHDAKNIAQRFIVRDACFVQVKYGNNKRKTKGVNLMFRRKDEFDLEGADNGLQGSLLASNTDTVSVLSTQQAAQYQSSQSTAASAPASTSFGVAAPSSLSRPVQTDATAPRSIPTPSPSSSFRPSSANDASRRPLVSETRSSLSSPLPRDGRRVLTVGSEILLKGEINTCDRLVIEGKVDATVTDVHTMELSEAGTFKGHAEVEYAEISGTFEGELVVKSALVIYSTGIVSGKITYGEIEIQRGGELSGEIKTVSMKTSTSSRTKIKEDKAA